MSTVTKSQLARLAFARLREIAPNETFDADDENTILTEIDLEKDRLESMIFDGVTLWDDDDAIPGKIVNGFLLSLLPSVASHYEAITVAPDMAGDGYRELCRQLTVSYDSDLLVYDPDYSF